MACERSCDHVEATTGVQIDRASFVPIVVLVACMIFIEERLEDLYVAV